MEYYSSIKMVQLLIHATTWVNLKSIILSARSQTRKTRRFVYMISFLWTSRKGKTRGLWLPGSLGGLLQRVIRELFMVREMFYIMTGGGGYMTVHIYQNSWNCTTKTVEFYSMQIISNWLQKNKWSHILLYLIITKRTLRHAF